MQLDKLAVSAVQMFRGANQFEFAARMAEQKKRTPHLSGYRGRGGTA